MTLNKNTFAALVCLLSLTGDVLAQRKPASGSEGKDFLFPIVEDKKWGFINKMGKVIIPPQFEAVWGGFGSDGQTGVKLGGKWGFIDETGRVIIKPQFDSFWKSSDGLRAVKLGLLIGYIDQAGKMAIKPQFDGVYEFSGDYALAQEGNLWGVIDRTGKFILKPQFHAVRGFYNGAASVHIKDPSGGGLWGILRTEDITKIAAGQKVSIKYNLFWPPIWSEGLGLVRLYCYKEGLAGPQYVPLVCQAFINTEGNIVFSSIELHQNEDGYFVYSKHMDITSDSYYFNDALDKPVREGFIPVTKEIDGDHKGGFLDKAGKLVIPLQFDLPFGFQEGLGLVCMGKKIERKCGFIDKTGEVVIPIQYKTAQLFSEGLAAVEKGGKWGYIDKPGHMVIKAQFDSAGSFQNGLAEIFMGEKRGYIDQNGKLIHNPSQ